MNGECLRSLTIFPARWHFSCSSARTTLTSQKNMDLVPCMGNACGVLRYFSRGGIFMPLCKDDTDVPQKYGSCAMRVDFLRSLAIFLARWHFLCRPARTTLTSKKTMDLVPYMGTACGVSRYFSREVAFFMPLCKDVTDVPQKYGSCAMHEDCLRSLTILPARWHSTLEETVEGYP